VEEVLWDVAFSAYFKSQRLPKLLEKWQKIAGTDMF